MESEDDDTNVRKAHDLSEIVRLASVWEVKLESQGVLKIFRIGKRLQGKSRPMLVSLASLEVKRSIMRNLQRLRENYMDITVVHGMTPEERRMNRELYLEAKRREGEEDLSWDWT